MNISLKRRMRIDYCVPKGEFKQADFSPSALAMYMTSGLYWSVIDTLKWSKKKGAWVNGEKEVADLTAMSASPFFRDMHIFWTK